MAYKPHLIWAKYGEKYYMLLYIGDRGDKAICIESRSVSNVDANKIREISKNNNFDSMDQFLGWMKKFIPHVFHMGYRELIKTKLEIVNSYDF